MIDEPRALETLRAEAPLFADVIVPRHFAGPFTYLIPTPLRPVLRVGHLVFVPFGRSLVQGAVIALTAHHPPTLPLERLKAIRTLATPDGASDIPPPLLRLSKAVAEAYVAPWGQCLRLVLPPKSRTVDSNRIILTKEGQEALKAKEPASSQRQLTPLDHEWQARVDQALEARRPARLLMQADPAERLRWLRSATAKTMQLGRKVLVIAGETARAESLAAALADSGSVTAVLHSMMSDKKRAAVWDRIRQNDVSVVVGTRAAVFVPLHPLGLIWVDRE